MPLNPVESAANWPLTLLGRLVLLGCSVFLCLLSVPDASPNDPDDRDPPEQQPTPLRLAPVIPLGIFDAREEAKKWW
jgi:hypothetical protein